MRLASTGLVGFNSRLREEATGAGGGEGLARQVSTHASVRRRPVSMRCWRRQRRRFNSRLREEATGRFGLSLQG